MASKLSQVVAVLGSQWGDEGKGKIVDDLSQVYDICARCNGGSNAGHTIVVNDVKYAFHLMPSGILNAKAQCIIGNGCVVHLATLVKELKSLEEKGVSYKGRVFMSDRAHLVFDFHQTIDGMSETALGSSKIGTTRKGIGPAYCEKMNRSGIRAGDLKTMGVFATKLRNIVATAQHRFKFEYDVEEEIKRHEEYAKIFADFIVDGIDWLNGQIESGKKVLIEGANATMLDIDFGTYPYVTSSSPSIGGCLTGLGISHKKVGDVIGVVKAYTTRVGEGPFLCELLDTDGPGTKMRAVGREFGTTTGRPRRCGWFDAVIVRYTNRINGYTALNLTKVDVLTGFESIKICVAYKVEGKRVTSSMPSNLEILAASEPEYETLPGWTEDISNVKKFDDLPENCRKYILRIEELVGVPVRWIGVGPSRTATVEH